MEKSKIEVFTSPTCPHCPSAVKLAKELEQERDDVFCRRIKYSSS